MPIIIKLLLPFPMPRRLCLLYLGILQIQVFLNISFFAKGLLYLLFHSQNPLIRARKKQRNPNPARSKDQSIKPTSDEVSYLGVSALVSSKGEESNSGNEEVYWLAPSPTFRPRNKVPRTDVVIIQFVFIITNIKICLCYRLAVLMAVPQVMVSFIIMKLL